MKKVKTFEEACALKEVDPKVLPGVSGLPEQFAKTIIAYYKLLIITSAINGKWQADFKDPDQPKYFPWAWVEEDKQHPTGFGFSNATYGYTFTLTYVGSRLCFETSEAAKYALNQFQDLYKDFWLS